MFFWNSFAFSPPVDVGNLISGSSAFSKSSLNIWKFFVYVLLKPGLEKFEHKLPSSALPHILPYSAFLHIFPDSELPHPPSLGTSSTLLTEHFLTPSLTLNFLIPSSLRASSHPPHSELPHILLTQSFLTPSLTLNFFIPSSLRASSLRASSLKASSTLLTQSCLTTWIF